MDAPKYPEVVMRIRHRASLWLMFGVVSFLALTAIACKENPKSAAGQGDAAKPTAGPEQLEPKENNEDSEAAAKERLAKEDPEVVAYFKDKKWQFGVERVARDYLIPDDR